MLKTKQSKTFITNKINQSNRINSHKLNLIKKIYNDNQAGLDALKYL